MVYKIYGLEYLGRKLKTGTEAKRFRILGEQGSLPTKEEIISIAKKMPGVKKTWVMKMDGNKWRKASDTFEVV